MTDRMGSSRQHHKDMTIKTAETLTLRGGQPACKSGNGTVSGNNKQEKRTYIKTMEGHNRARQLYKNISMLFLFPVKRDLLFTNI